MGQGQTENLSGMQRAVRAMPSVQVVRDGKSATLTKQAAMAVRLGVTQQAVSSWECRGWAPTKRCDEISQLTGVPARDLMDPRVRAMVEQVAAA